MFGAEWLGRCKLVKTVTGNVVGSTQTESRGNVSFPGLKAGDFIILETNLANYYINCAHN
jgi:hypothetical protein